jgi:hypothetical protein
MLPVNARTLDVRGAGAARWLSEGMLESLLEINRECLALIAEQAAALDLKPHPALRQIADHWRALDERARWRAAACPFLLLDAGFASPERWQRGGGGGVADAQCSGPSPFFSVPRAAPVARMVYVYAWSLVLTQPAAARLVLGIHPGCARVLAECTVPEVHELAESHCATLRPRWLVRGRIWRELLLAAAEGDAPALERAHMHGVQLLAAEAWSVPLVRRPTPALLARAASLTRA